MGYTKLFEELVKSSIWAEDDKTRIIWITLLASKDRNHFVRGTVSWLSAVARVSKEDCLKSLEKLSSPDLESHCTEEEGRRIVAKPGGWHIVSGEYYSQKLNEAERREYKRTKQEEYRRHKPGLKRAAQVEGATQAVSEGLVELSEKTSHDVTSSGQI